MELGLPRVNETANQRPPLKPVVLARYRPGDDYDSFVARCETHAAPLVLVDYLFKLISKKVREINDTFDRRTARIEALEARNQALEARLAELEDKALWDAGVWRSGTVYPKAATVSHSGTIWFAQTTTTSPPGSDHTWRMGPKTRVA